MNARKARQLRAAERARMTKLLAAADAATPEYMGNVAGSEAWKVGPVLCVVPTILDAYPAELKTAIDRRRRATLTGRCDCGARRQITGKGFAVEHEEECPATDGNVIGIAARHGIRMTRWA